jgi:PAS domain S-box-containing protein
MISEPIHDPMRAAATGISHLALTQALDEHSPVGFIVLDADGYVLQWSRAVERATGYGADETVGQRFPLVPKEEQGRFAGILGSIAQGTPWTGQHLRRPRKDGSLVDLEISAYPVRADDGVCVVVGLIQDVSDQTRNRALHNRLTEVTSAVSGFADLDRVLRMVRDAMIEFGGFDRAGVFQVYGSRVLGAWGTGPDGEPRREAGLEETLDDWGPSIGDLAEGRRPYVIEDWVPDDNPAGGPPIPHVVMAMRAGDELVGLVSLDNLLSGRPVLESDVLPLMPFAEEAAIAIRAARLHERARTYADDLELEVAQRTNELERVVADLEQFTYRVAHDLRAPLRAIDALAHFIEEDLPSEADAPDSEMRSRLRRVARSARHAGRLVDDLLTLARVGRCPYEPMTLSPAEAAEMAWHTMADVRAGTSARIEVAPMPRVVADRDMLVAIYQRLFDNALKFARPEVETVIRIGSRPCEAENMAELYVRDNGIGFDDADAARMFGVFARLHRPDEYPGSGIGLAIVSRIVERHGGRVGASGVLGEGAVICWRMPAGDA